MKRSVEFLARVVLLVFIWLVWWWALNAPLSNVLNLSIIVGGVLLTFPIVWFGRMIPGQRQAISRAAWVATFVHFRFGASYLEYKSKTPMLFPRRPKG